jgi:hypothetical protein
MLGSRARKCACGRRDTPGVASAFDELVARADLADRPSRLFADLEPVVRARGFGDVLDEWAELDLVR